MLKQVPVLLALLGLLVLPSAASAAVAVTDYSGHRVALAQPAQRIVALTPHIVENLFSAGLGDRIVGAVNHSDYPAAAKTIPRVGSYNNLSLEAIVAKKPDLVVAWADGGTQDIVRRLRALGLAVYVDAPRRLSDIARSIRDFGVLGDTEARARRAAAAFKKQIAILRQHFAGRREVPLFFEVWSDPLRTLSGAGMVGSVIRLCGGHNLFADAPVIAPQVSIESVIARDPKAIVAAGVADAKPHWKTYWQRWPAIAAVAHDHFVTVPADLISRPTVRIAEGAADLCRKLDQVRHDISDRDSSVQRQPDSDPDNQGSGDAIHQTHVGPLR